MIGIWFWIGLGVVIVITYILMFAFAKGAKRGDVKAARALDIEKTKQFYKSRTDVSLLRLRDQIQFDDEMDELYPEYKKENGSRTQMLQLIQEEIDGRILKQK